jgi:hypothetical protein
VENQTIYMDIRILYSADVCPSVEIFVESEGRGEEERGERTIIFSS